MNGFQHMSTASACTVDFVGGPLDGHAQFIAIAPGDLNDVVLLPVDRVLALLYDDRGRQRLSTLAVYELMCTGAARPSYQYLGCVKRD